jgi:hypothetical protein
MRGLRRTRFSFVALAFAALASACSGASGHSSATTATTTARAAVSPPPTSATGSTVAPATATSTTPVAGKTSCTSVVHIGDSTSVGLISPAYIADPSLRIGAQYARVGVAATAQHLEIEGARSIVETLKGQLNAFQVATQLVRAGYHGCWVLALGTTDTANVAIGAGIDRATRINKMLTLIGNDPVLWVNVKTLLTKGAWSEPQMALWDQALQAAAATHPNMKIYDWASVVQDSWFGKDQIHYTSAGYEQRAHLIADALAANFPATA